jgi:hypothetical protein
MNNSVFYALLGALGGYFGGKYVKLSPAVGATAGGVVGFFIGGGQLPSLSGPQPPIQIQTGTPGGS